MVIDGRLPQGYVVICSSGHPARSFLVKRLGPSVECPACGCTALSPDLAAAFHLRSAQDAVIAMPSRKPPRSAAGGGRPFASAAGSHAPAAAAGVM
jgi:hypothetical protein